MEENWTTGVKEDGWHMQERLRHLNRKKLNMWENLRLLKNGVTQDKKKKKTGYLLSFSDVIYTNLKLNRMVINTSHFSLF